MGRGNGPPCGSGFETRRVRQPGLLQPGRRAALPIHLGLFVQDAALSRDGRLAVTACYDKTVRVWDATTGDPLTPPLKHSNTVSAVAFSPDGRRVLTGAYDPLGLGAMGP